MRLTSFTGTNRLLGDNAIVDNVVYALLIDAAILQQTPQGKTEIDVLDFGQVLQFENSTTLQVAQNGINLFHILGHDFDIHHDISFL